MSWLGGDSLDTKKSHTGTGRRDLQVFPSQRLAPCALLPIEQVAPYVIAHDPYVRWDVCVSMKVGSILTGAEVQFPRLRLVLARPHKDSTTLRLRVREDPLSFRWVFAQPMVSVP